MVIERAFGLLKTRFRRLKGLHMNNLHQLSLAVTACCILHNICLETECELQIDEALGDNVANDVNQPHNPPNDNHGVNKRNGIAASLYIE
ncbi:hypothetical protein EOD39_12991 [Acipenser ruthenus]|uniref:DDE Tnp4 domain-containing protein n=2 Tax=Acipenseridae TaxID=7900 RepID=A0A662YPS7_ACIRT|nr:hypothetical protein EOD39_12991 [Acipenser ruthenus]